MIRLGKYEIHFWPPMIWWPGEDGIWTPLCLNCHWPTHGCRNHWFCGMCEKCRQKIEHD